MIYIWCSDNNPNSGEGILANKFINDLRKYNKNKKIKIITPKLEKIIFFRKIFKNTFDRFFIPLIGVFYLWFLFFFKRNKKLCFANYLPLWNFIIFLILPPKTILGPITGGSSFLKKPILNFLIRKYIFFIFYKLSVGILNIRQKKLLFSTDLLMKTIHKRKNYFTNYVLKDFEFRNYNINKKYDIIFYLRSHKNKNTKLMIKVANELSKNHKVATCGDKIKNLKIKNFGQISRNKLSDILKKTKYSFISTENVYSFFSLDCIKNGVQIFCNNHGLKNNVIRKNLHPLDYNSYESLIFLLKKKLNNKYLKSKKIVTNQEDNFYKYFKL